jgi:hypothetical protein
VRDEAVSTVIGALLVLAFAVGALTLFQLTVVPDLEERSEADHTKTLARDMGDLSADVLRQTRSTSQGSLFSPVSVSPDPPPFVPASTATGSLSFEPATDGAAIESPSLTVVARNGSHVLQTSSGWETVQSGDTIEDIDSVIGLHLTITDDTPDDRLVLEATDTDGDFAGDLQVIATTDQSTVDLAVQVRDANSDVVVHNHLLSIDEQRWDGDFWIDALDDLYGFGTPIENATGPVTLTFTDRSLAAEYKVAYHKQVAPDLTTTVGAGQTTTDYRRTIPSGVITYESQTEHLPDQSLAIDHGGLVRSQAEGNTFLIDPPLQAQAGGGFVKLGLDVPALEGVEDSVSGSEIATVRTTTTDHETMSATAGQLTLTWPTDHPEAWEAFLDAEMDDAGLTSRNCPPSSPTSACQYEVTTTATQAELVVHGPTAQDADPSDPDRDIALDLQRGAIQTEVQQ